jgi:TfoX/Sxy family transcriptional regulator of competence genes
MPYSEILADRIRELLVDVPKVQEKRMFRGVAFMVNKKMCVNVSGDSIMCRIDPAIHESAVERDGCSTVNMRGRDLRGWVYVDQDVLRTEKALKYWVDLALDFNRYAKTSTKKKKK